MTDDRIDWAKDDIDWVNLFDALAAASGFAEMASSLDGSGVLVSQDHVDVPDDVEIDDFVAAADLQTLRAFLTSLVREDRFSPGTGDRYFWWGDFDMVIDAIAERLGMVYPLPPSEYVLPRRIPPCPTCGSGEMVAVRIAGMPPGPPVGFDMSRVIFEGCTVMDDLEPDLHCRRDGTDYDYPYVSDADWWAYDGGSFDA
ncbi:MAG TPA: hypothetical protein VLA29_05910 [Acidimicrobiia bacterium]|nr:hypothetical protein [Acidimicrobiia bacterium]